MKKFKNLVSAICFLSLGLSSAYGQSAKFSAAAADIAVLDSEQMNWSTILSTNIKSPNQKELLFGVSLECGLYTKTVVKSKGGSQDTSSAEAKVSVRVLIDGKVIAAPGVITFCERQQELSAKLGGIIESCSDSNLDGTIVMADECLISDEEISLMQRTMAAHSFNLISYNISSGSHKVELQAKIESKSSAQEGEASARATIGKGSLIVEEVRAVQGEISF